MFMTHGYDPKVAAVLANIAGVYYLPKEIGSLKRSLLGILDEQKFGEIPTYLADWIKLTSEYNLCKHDNPNGRIPLNYFEQNVLRLLGENLTAQQLAKELKSSLSYIKKTKAQLTKKFGLMRSNHLFAYGIVFGYTSKMLGASSAAR
jgi:DNA-binding CsgD family transcriptional regulator